MDLGNVDETGAVGKTFGKRKKAMVEDDPEKEKEQHIQAIFEATRQGDFDRVESLLKLGVSLHTQRSKDGETLLEVAVKHGHLAVVQLLLSAGSDPTVPCSDGAPLFVSIIELDYDVILEEVLSCFEEPEKWQDIHGNSCLHTACRMGSFSCTQFLLSLTSFHIEFCNSAGRNALHQAILYGKVPLVEALLSKSPMLIASVVLDPVAETVFHLVATSFRSKHINVISSFQPPISLPMRMPFFFFACTFH